VKDKTALMDIKRAFFFLYVVLFLGMFLTGCQSDEMVFTYSIKNPIFSPDGESIVFDRCDANYPERCRIHIFNIKTGELGYYQAPPGQTWDHANFSYSGDKLVFVTSPVGDREKNIYELRHQVLPKHQIAIMDMDGSNYKVITDTPYLKIHPAFSRSGDKVIFPQAGRIRDSGKTLASKWDLREVNLKTGENYLFSRSYKFYQMGLPVFFPDDERVLVFADVPMAEDLVGPNGALARNIDDFHDKYGITTTFVLKRGDRTPREPLDIGIHELRHITMDVKGNFYVKGAIDKKGWLEIYIVRKNRQIISLGQGPTIGPDTSGSDYQPTVSPDGKYFIIPMESPTVRRKFMMLNTETKVWQELQIPKASKRIN